MSKVKQIFTKIYNDMEIREIYNAINKRENDNVDAWCHHDFNHVNNVKDLVVEIMTKFKFEEDFIEEAKIAAILHDVGAVQGKQNHAERSYEFAKDYFVRNEINLPHSDLVLEAIKNHSYGFDSDNIIQTSLILADKLDIKYTRPTRSGLEVEGNRQFKNINDIIIDIKQDTLEVFFITNEELNKTELEDYYFMDKVGYAIKSFASKFTLKYKIYLNDNEWFELYK